MLISREITGQAGIDRAYENAGRGAKRFEGRILGHRYITFRGWEMAELLVGDQPRNFRAGRGEVGRCNVKEIKKGDRFREEGRRCCQMPQRSKRRDTERPVDLLIRRPAAVSPAGQGRRRRGEPTGAKNLRGLGIPTQVRLRTHSPSSHLRRPGRSVYER